MVASKRGKDTSTTAPSTGTPADKRKKGNGGKKPGPTAGTAAAKKGSAAGGRASGKGASAKSSSSSGSSSSGPRAAVPGNLRKVAPALQKAAMARAGKKSGK